MNHDVEPDAVLTRVGALIRELVPDLGQDAEIAPAVTFEALGLTSLLVVDLVGSVEADFDVTITDQQLVELRQVGDLTGLLADLRVA
ncbi:hypothetical protein BLA60_36885 [Actinophytocola xinjiangensis]|uniref:Carrier domain-containing protein n=1 Tax=Actinophytocola xinjiangensis TaxID=485602 RepID=A0A7Z1ATV7_9PSEU|nr:phosphopantetheine-binding protein [Actinophytocola xinjiangensis]OLF05237.1 hypothetical protein BLA60_36885 [Actinophytocola xinjiangensis]